MLLIVFLDSINEEDLDGSVSVGHMAFLFTIRVQRGNQLFSSPFDSVQKGHTLRLGGIDYFSVANTLWGEEKEDETFRSDYGETSISKDKGFCRSSS